MSIPIDKLRDLASVQPFSGDPVVYERWQLASELLACREELAAERERFNLLSQRCDAAELWRERLQSVLLSRHGGEPLALLSELDEARAERDAARAEMEELRTEWFGIAGGENSFPSDRGGDAIAQQQVGSWIADGQAARAEAEKLRAELAALRGRDAKPFDWDGVPTVEEWIAENLRERKPRAGRVMVELHPDEVVAYRGESRRIAGWLKDLLAELAAVKRQRDELLEAAKLAIREIRPSTDCSMCHDSTWDHECDSKVNTTHVALSNAIKGAIAAEQPAPALKRDELAELKRQRDELRDWCSLQRAEWLAHARTDSVKSVRASCAAVAGAFCEVLEKIEALAAEQPKPQQPEVQP